MDTASGSRDLAKYTGPIRADAIAAKRKGDRLISMCPDTDRGEMVRQNGDAISAELPDISKDRAYCLFIEVFYCPDLCAGIPHMACLISSLQMDKDKVIIPQAGDGISCLCLVIRIKISGSPGNTYYL